jgi:hypothetical protein
MNNPRQEQINPRDQLERFVIYGRQRIVAEAMRRAMEMPPVQAIEAIEIAPIETIQATTTPTAQEKLADYSYDDQEAYISSIMDQVEQAHLDNPYPRAA